MTVTGENRAENTSGAAGAEMDNGSPELSDDEYQRICQSMPSDMPLSRPMLENTAFLYRHQKQRRERGTGRGLKADLRRLRRITAAFADALENLPFPIPLFITVVSAIRNSPDGDTFTRIKRLSSEADLLDRAIGEALNVTRRPIPDLQAETGLAVELLIRIYERATGRKATHSTHKGTLYIGGAQSAFGRLAWAFFQVVDPSLSETRVGNLIRKRLHRGQRKR